MPNDAQKLPLSRTMEQWGGRKWQAAQDLLGKSLPASVVKVVSSGIVTVKFELANVPFTLPQITVPFLGSEFVRIPIQVGMLGWVMSADAYLGGVSGLGGGTADLSPLPNLANLVFSPVGNSAWSATDNPNAVVIYGPDGAIVRTVDKSSMLTVTKEENSWLSPATAPVTIKGNLVVQGNVQIQGLIEDLNGGTYSGDIKTTGEIYAKVGAGQVGLSTHQHSQAADSHGDTEQPTNAPTGGT